jgi:hypothetical protein
MTKTFSGKFPTQTTKVSLIKRAYKSVGAYFQNTSGAIAIVWGVLLPVMIGSVGIGVEVGLWYNYKRNSQSAADAAAHAAAYQILDEADEDSIVAAAKADARRNGFDSDDAEVTVVVHHPPITGDHIDDDDFAEVYVTRSYAPLFARLFTNSGINVRTRAVAGAGGGGGLGEYCVLSTRTDDTGIQISGNVTIATGCGMATSSDIDASFDVAGGAADIYVSEICSEGGIDAKIGVFVDEFGDPDPDFAVNPDKFRENCRAPENPLDGIAEPDVGSCNCDETDYNVTANGGEIDLVPGIYCGGIQVTGGSNTITFAEGIYILAGGGMKVTGSDNVLTNLDNDTPDDGVMFYNTADCDDGSYGDVDLAGGSTYTLRGRAAGETYEGILFFNDTSDDNDTDFSVLGNGTVNLDGLIYYNNDGGVVEFGGTASGGYSCFARIIAWGVDLHGDPGSYSENSSCVGSVISIPGSGAATVRLYE